MYEFETFTDAYLHLSRELAEDWDYESCPRGMKVREKLGVRFKVRNPRHRIPYVAGRKYRVQYLIAESLWYFMASNSTDWISYYAPFWADISDDGKTANSAYGSRVFLPHPRIAGGAYSQWDWVISELKRDPHSRRAVIHIKTAEDTIKAQKDVPCTLALHFFIRDEKLHLVANMRSTDLVLGLAYDVPAFTFMQEAMANELGVELGTYTHTSNSLHVYERHFEMLDEIFARYDESEAHAWNRGAMKNMPRHIPVLELTQFESRVRGAQTLEELRHPLAILESSVDPYWNDWGLVLASHRAMRLGFKKEGLDLLKKTNEQLHPVR